MRYIILSGRVKVLIPDEEGHEVILAFMGPNEFFGEMGLLDDQPRSASVETLEPCEMLRFSKTGFIACLKDNFDLAMIIIRNLVKRLRDADRSIESLALIDVYGRVARLLLDHAVEIDGLWTVKQAPPKQEMARMIGASREMVSRVMKDLQQRGYIRTEKRKVILLDKMSMSKRARPAIGPSKRAGSTINAPAGAGGQLNRLFASFLNVLFSGARQPEKCFPPALAL